MHSHREMLRTEFGKNSIDTNNNIILGCTLLTITSNKTNCSEKDFKQNIKTINAKLNRKIFGRKFFKNRNRIIFHTFYEESGAKRLRHCHIFLRVPKLLNPLLGRNIFNCHIEVNEIKNEIIKYLEPLVRKQACDYLDSRDLIPSRKDSNPAIRYSSKHYNLEHNPNYEIY